MSHSSADQPGVSSRHVACSASRLFYRARRYRTAPPRVLRSRSRDRRGGLANPVRVVTGRSTPCQRARRTTLKQVRVVALQHFLTKCSEFPRAQNRKKTSTMPKRGKRSAASKKNGALGGRSSGPAGGHPTADAPQGAAALVAPSKKEADRPRNKPSAVPLVRRDPDRICLERRREKEVAFCCCPL